MFLNRLHRVTAFECAKCFYCNSSGSFRLEKAQKMSLFWEKEMFHAANLRYDILTDEEKVIHALHDEAVKKGHFTYYDPQTKERVLTRLRHHLRGKCCGNACRHCVYDHENVLDEQKLKVRTFNSSFWTYPELKYPDFDDSIYFDGSNLKRHANKSSPSKTFAFSESKSIESKPI